MGALHARSHIRRGIGVLAAVVILAMVPVPAPARADTAAEWQGSFTAAYADPAVVGLDQWSAVRFVVSQPLQNGASAAWVVIRDAKGAAVTWCNSGTECVWNFNPAPGATETFTAQLGTARNGQSVVIDTTGPVSVTDIGWSGDFSYARADNPAPAVDQSTYVRFGVTEPLSLAYLHVNDEMGAIVTDCSQGVECVIPANPSPGETKTYTARLRVYLDGHWVERSVRSVSVTDPGWNGTIVPDANNPSFVQANTQAWFHYTATAPPYSTTIKVYVDGVLQGSCGGNNNATCGANFAVGANQVHVVRADVVPYLLGGTQEVRASATSVVTSKTPEQFADFLLTATPVELEATLGTALATEVKVLQQAVRGPSFCLSLGLSRPTFRLRSSVPDLTLACMAGVSAVLIYLLKQVGIEPALQLAHDAADNPANLDPLDPNYPAGGGLNPDGTQCHQYDFDGNCIEGLEPNPEPALQVAADGARIPPPANCMDDVARNRWLTETPVEAHHIITQFENQTQPGASDVQIEKSVDVDALQTIAAWYGLNWANGQWNLISIPHKGPHPPAYHEWLLDQVRAIDAVTQGDTVAFLGLWQLLVRDTIAADPSIVGYDYWKCRG